MRGPEVTVSDMRCEKPVVQRIQTRSASHRRNVIRKLSCVYSNENVAGDARRAAWIRDASQNQFAEIAVAYSNKVTFSRVRIVIVHSARAIRAVAGSNQTAECCRYD